MADDCRVRSEHRSNRPLRRTQHLRPQGRRLAAESRSVPVLIEQHIGNPKVAANYSPGDQIHYRTGSPERYGLPHNGSARVITAEPKKNMLIVETNVGERVAYDPSQLRVQTAQSRVYREETREIAVGDRIRLTMPDRNLRVRSGDFATVERLGRDNSVSIRLDSGKNVELTSEKAKYIEYGYSVDAGQRIAADRILVTAESIDAKTLAAIALKARDLAIYTADGAIVQKQQPNSLSEQIAPNQTLPLPQKSQGYGLRLEL